MVARHPHVFTKSSQKKSKHKQTQDWEKIKEEERKALNQNRTLDGVALGLPALTRAIKLQNRAARVGFDWPKVDSVLDKVSEEIIELTEAKSALHRHEEFGDLMFVLANLARHLKIDPEQSLRDANKKFTRRFRHEEFGDLMFVLANLARHLKIDPEQSLRDANKKFTRRFNEVERKLYEKGSTPTLSNLTEMDALWNEVKGEEK